MLFHGYYVDGSEVVPVHCLVTDLNVFIRCSEDSAICVSDEDGNQFLLKKKDVTWDNRGVDL